MIMILTAQTRSTSIFWFLLCGISRKGESVLSGLSVFPSDLDVILQKESQHPGLLVC